MEIERLKKLVERMDSGFYEVMEKLNPKITMNCAEGHPEITFECDECPMCEIKAVIAENTRRHLECFDDSFYLTMDEYGDYDQQRKKHMDGCGPIPLEWKSTKKWK